MSFSRTTPDKTEQEKQIISAKEKMAGIFAKEIASGKYQNPTEKSLGGLTLDFKFSGKPEHMHSVEWHNLCHNTAHELLFPNGMPKEQTTSPQAPKWDAKAEKRPYWTRLDDGDWYAMGPKGLDTGDNITIYKRNGDSQTTQVAFAKHDGFYHVAGPKEYVGKSCWECGCVLRWRNSDRCISCDEEEI